MLKLPRVIFVFRRTWARPFALASLQCWFDPELFRDLVERDVHAVDSQRGAELSDVNIFRNVLGLTCNPQIDVRAAVSPNFFCAQSLSLRRQRNAYNRFIAHLRPTTLTGDRPGL